jgi:hypothetical protein
MVYYDRPTKFAPGLEEKIIDEVRRQVPGAFAAGAARANEPDPAPPSGEQGPARSPRAGLGSAR